MATTAVDLTPFGLTATENLAYRALLELGPSSGYAVAKQLSIARANTYQALNGLVAKGCAVGSSETPRRFRAVSPSAVLALMTRRHVAALDLLELQVSAQPKGGAPHTVGFKSEREFHQLILRTATRAPSTVTFVGPSKLLELLLPIWRKRAADQSATMLWAVGEAPSTFPLPLEGTVHRESVRSLFGSDAAILSAAEQAILARLEGSLSGIWTSDPILVGAARAAVVALTA